MSQVLINGNSASQVSLAYPHNGATNGNGYDSPNQSGTLTDDTDATELKMSRSLVDISTNTRLKNSYQLAVKQYLNRDFSAAWRTVIALIDEITTEKGSSPRPKDQGLRVNIFRLYLSLTDLLLKDLSNSSKLATEEAVDSFPEMTLAQRLTIRDIFLRGQVFDQMCVIHSHDLRLLDPDLVLMCFIIEISNGISLALLKDQVVAVLNENPLPMDSKRKESIERISDFYVRHVLVKQGLVDEARTFIGHRYALDDELALKALEDLDTAIRKQAEDERRAREHKRHEEKQRQSSKKKQLEQGKKEEERRRQQHEERRLKKDKHEVSRPHHGFGENLLASVKEVLFPEHLNNAGLVERLARPTFAFAVVLSLTLSIRNLMSANKWRSLVHKLKFLVILLFAKLKETATMATSVTYL